SPGLAGWSVLILPIRLGFSQNSRTRLDAWRKLQQRFTAIAKAITLRSSLWEAIHLRTNRFLSRAAVLLLALLLPGVARAEPLVPHGTAIQRAQSAMGLVAFTLIAFVIGRL